MSKISISLAPMTASPRAGLATIPRTTEEQNRMEQGGKREVCSGVKQILHSGNDLSVDYVCS